MEQERRRRSTGKVDRLPPELKDTVEQMLLTGCTYKEIVAFLKANGEEMSQMAICTYARKYLATVEMINVAQSNFSMLNEPISGSGYFGSPDPAGKPPRFKCPDQCG